MYILIIFTILIISHSKSIFFCPDNCERCLGNICIECQKGYGLDGDDCKKCSEHCISCSNNTCNICDESYYLSIDKKCEPCMVGCFNCTKKDYCNDCYFAYYNKNGKCENCTTEGCLECDGSDKCYQCQFNYTRTDGGDCKKKLSIMAVGAIIISTIIFIFIVIFIVYCFKKKNKYRNIREDLLKLFTAS